MSNLHVDLDEANKHTPKGFTSAVENMLLTKDELGQSTYSERMSLPKAINFVDGTVAAPTTLDGDIYVLTGSGTVDASWGAADFGDWVRFNNSIPTAITPLSGYLCYDVTASEWKEFDGSVWATFGGGGATGYETNGGSGGSGIVVLKWLANEATITIGGSLVYTDVSSGDYSIIKFTSGSDDVSFA